MCLHFVLALMTFAVVPSGIDFSMFPAERTANEFKRWVTVRAANGDVLDQGRWGEFYGKGTRAEYMEAIADTLVTGGCVVEQRGDVLVVRTLNGSPVVKVEVRTTGPGPRVVLAPRAPPAPKPKKDKE